MSVGSSLLGLVSKCLLISPVEQKTLRLPDVWTARNQWHCFLQSPPFKSYTIGSVEIIISPTFEWRRQTTSRSLAPPGGSSSRWNGELSGSAARLSHSMLECDLELKEEHILWARASSLVGPAGKLVARWRRLGAQLAMSASFEEPILLVLILPLMLVSEPFGGTHGVSLR